MRSDGNCTTNRLANLFFVEMNLLFSLQERWNINWSPEMRTQIHLDLVNVRYLNDVTFDSFTHFSLVSFVSVWSFWAQWSCARPPKKNHEPICSAMPTLSRAKSIYGKTWNNLTVSDREGAIRWMKLCRISRLVHWSSGCIKKAL